MGNEKFLALTPTEQHTALKAMTIPERRDHVGVFAPGTGPSAWVADVQHCAKQMGVGPGSVTAESAGAGDNECGMLYIERAGKTNLPARALVGTAVLDVLRAENISLEGREISMVDGENLGGARINVGFDTLVQPGNWLVSIDQRVEGGAH